MKKDFQSTLATIKAHGYWKIHVYPNSMNFIPIEPINKGKEIIRNASVQLKGWDYPHFPTQVLDHQNIYIAGDKVEAWIDYNQFKEIWRLYDTGQFIHLFALREDWLKEDSRSSSRLKEILPGTALEITSAVYSITEIYAFIRNLILAVLYRNEVVVEITLVGTKNRNLFIFDPLRMPLIGEHKSVMNKVVFPKKVYRVKDLETNYLGFAFEQIIHLFNQFNWDNPPLQVIKEDQKKLIERRL